MGWDAIMGQSTRVLANIVRLDKPQLQNVFSLVCGYLKYEDKVQRLVFFCDHGNHRSAGVENLTANAIALCAPWNIHSAVHIMKRHWPRKKCG